MEYYRDAQVLFWFDLIDKSTDLIGTDLSVTIRPAHRKKNNHDECPVISHHVPQHCLMHTSPIRHRGTRFVEVSYVFLSPAVKSACYLLFDAKVEPIVQTKSKRSKITISQTSAFYIVSTPVSASRPPCASAPIIPQDL